MESFEMNNSAIDKDSSHLRRSANYKPNIWKYDFLQSLHNKHESEGNATRAMMLVEDVKQMLIEAVSLKANLELMDNIMKFGLATLFEKEIKETLEIVAMMEPNDEKSHGDSTIEEHDLYTIALRFRLLRQHGYEVSEDVFRSFKDKNGGFVRAKFGDTKGVRELLEAAHFGLGDGTIMEKAKIFSMESLKKICNNSVNNCGGIIEEVPNDNQVVHHALELPLHWRVEWFDARWQIRFHEKEKSGDVNCSMVKLAKIHFNAVQATHQKDLKELSRWWRDLRLVENLSFTRDRLVECFLCAVGLAHEPKHSSFRKALTKVIIFVLVIDDVYDLYGSLEELQCFTAAVDRWNLGEMQHLPECMKLCFQALDDVTNEIAYEIGAEKGWMQVLPHLRKVWGDFCKSLLVEAKWFSLGYTPSLEEYLENAWVSSSGPLILTHSIFFHAHEDLDGAKDLLEMNKDLVYNSSLIIRLCNDLGTSEAESNRGDAPSSILCYMQEENVSEEEALMHVRGLIVEAWKNINGRSILAQHSPSLQSLIRLCSNAARVAHMLYQSGDGFGVQDGDIRQQILSSLIEPFAMG
ncbi:alpha-farnesene synthase-like isoform X1 [Punica granatum]|uniref:Alpha-farnesene synthase-like isoform X1 n=2 Tax=Punica granatum TaxID=22663 RepID=A0A6P8DF91_PUNGR|nr:alpha-farnesene synthase-like isoform X1 [Punica granatum]XP_031395270.1 alpha-farnesene synthase-like isoform X1 [Punica granatum]XP_031395271.1 alpha-farnesene synthase-like isoform X1 [Punica granatum]XP_031395272.1 alpha-farnesene synthase-like isoform X1 [Punica granatum]